MKEKLPSNYKVVIRIDIGRGGYCAIAKVKDANGEHCAQCFFDGLSDTPTDIYTYPIKKLNYTH